MLSCLNSRHLEANFYDELSLSKNRPHCGHQRDIGTIVSFRLETGSWSVDRQTVRCFYSSVSWHHSIHMPYEVQDKADFYVHLKNAGPRLVVVTFHTTWCGPSKLMSLIIKEIVEEIPAVIFFKVDANECKDLKSQYNIIISSWRIVPRWQNFLGSTKINWGSWSSNTKPCPSPVLSHVKIRSSVCGFLFIPNTIKKDKQ